MRILRQFFAAFVLTLTLALSVNAGVMSTPIAPPQPAPTSATTEGEITTGVDGEMSTTNSVEASAGNLVGAALGLVQSVLSLV